jgi:hypothetical protein
MIGDRWGVTESETLRRYPCDDFVSSPVLRAWRGVHIDAPADAVWPWVAQVRLAPYSYDWIDNRGRRSPRELAGLPEPEVGMRFTATGGRAIGRIASTRWRSQFGKYRGSASSLRAGRIRARPRSGQAKNDSVSPPDSPLSVTRAVPGGGRFAGWSVSICRACSRSPKSLGFARPNPVTVPSQAISRSSSVPSPAVQVSSLGNRCPTCLAAARSQCRSSSKRSSALGHGQAYQLGVGHLRRLAGPAAAEPPREGMMRSVSFTYSAVRRVSRSAITVGSRSGRV